MKAHKLFSQERAFTGERNRKDADVTEHPIFVVKIVDINIYTQVFTHLLDDVGHTVPVCQFDVVSPIHQALVSLQGHIQFHLSVSRTTAQIQK